MSSFDTLERSIESSEPIEVYEFLLGTTPFRFTTSEDEITFDSNDYTPESISRNSIAQGKDERQRLLQVTMPLTNSYASKYIGIPPGERASLTVTRLQRNEVPAFDNPRLMFDGFVQSVRFPDNRSAILGVQSLEAATSQIMPRFTFQGLCNHFLYDSQCAVDPLGFRISGALVTGVSGKVITVTGAAASGLDFTGGFVTPNGVSDFRMVTSQSGDDLTLLLPFSVNVLSLTVDVFAGCNREIDGDCLNVFDNVAEFGGFAFIPLKNPFETGIQTS